MKFLRSFVLTLMAMTCGTVPVAGQGLEWKGKVIDEEGQALQYANVVLMSLPDSAMVAGTVTGMDGAYSIMSDARNVVLRVSMIGYRTVSVSNPAGGTVKMEPDVETLGEVTVTAVLPKTTLTDQGMQTNIRGSVLETAGTASDALERVPGLIKSQDGLEVVGKGTPLIYINGRKVSDIKELDRLQSNEIQNVEVITNPGAQYSASVRSVVRIRTIKHQGDGFSFNAGFEDAQSLRNAYNDPMGYLNVNFRHNGLDVFAGGNALKFTSRQQSDMLQQTFGTPGFRQQGELDFVQEATSYSANGGMNWQINDSHSVGFRVEGDVNPRIDIHQVIDEDVFRGDTQIDRLLSEGNHGNDDNPHGLNANVYYNGTTGKLGIDFNADYYGMTMSQDAHTVESSSMAADDAIDYITHSDNRMYAAKLVLSYPVWKGAMQTGTEDVFSHRSDDYDIKAVNSNNVPASASKVTEDNLALFASYGFYIPKIGQMSAGVRYEHVDYAYDDILGTDDLERIYDNLFPTLSYANAFGPLQMQLSYSAKTIRPNFGMLSSAIRYHSRYILQSGNSKLQPQTNHDFGLTMNWKFLTLIGEYSRVDDAITQWSSLYDPASADGIVLVRSVNLDTPVRQMALVLNAAPTIGPWNMNYTVGVQQQWLELECPDAREASGFRTVSFSDMPLYFAQLNNTLRFKHDWQLELGTEYHTRSYSLNSMISNQFLDVTAAVQKSFLDGGLVVRLEGKDLAGKADYDARIDCGSHIIEQTNVMDSKRLTLSVRYSFNTAASKYKGTGAGQETARRMGK